MLLITLATNFELFEVQIFKTIAKKFGYNLIIYGENRKWTNFKTKIELFNEVLQNIDDDEYIICSDCYDVLPLRSSKEFELQVQKLIDRNIKIMASAEMYCLTNCKTMKIWHEKSPHKINNGLKYVNAGLIWGKSKNLKHFWSYLLKNNFEDDQIGLSTYFDLYPNDCMLDQDSEFFQTSACNKYVPRIGSNYLSEESKQGYGTFFVHIPSLSQHLVQREYYKTVLNILSKRLNIEHLTGMQTKTSISSILEKYLFLLLVCILVIYYILKTKNV